MAGLNFQFILEKDRDDAVQRNRPVNRKFQCSFCNAYFYRINFTVYECLCGVTVEDLTNHEFVQPQLLFNQSSRLLQSTTLDLGVFGIKSQTHSGAILLFDVHFPAAILTVEDAFEYIHPYLSALVPQLSLSNKGVYKYPLQLTAS
jgi:Tfp pilus assembly pilus retraction ATPase PilT